MMSFDVLILNIVLILSEFFFKGLKTKLYHVIIKLKTYFKLTGFLLFDICNRRIQRFKVKRFRIRRFNVYRNLSAVTPAQAGLNPAPAGIREF